MIHVHSISKIFSVLILSTFLLASCDNSDNDDDVAPTPAENTPTEVPPTTPPTTPPVTNPPNTPTERPLWTQIRTHHVSDMVVEGQCEYPWVMTIKRNGSFSGVCNGEKFTGRLTRNEVAELDQRADLVAEDIDGEVICQELQPMIEEHYLIWVPGEGAERFFDSDFGRGWCYQGGIADASSLRDYVRNSILEKYFKPQPIDED